MLIKEDVYLTTVVIYVQYVILSQKTFTTVVIFKHEKKVAKYMCKLKESLYF